MTPQPEIGIEFAFLALQRCVGADDIHRKCTNSDRRAWLHSTELFSSELLPRFNAAIGAEIMVGQTD